MTGPVSQALEQEILGKLRRHGIVVWLDTDASYTRFVDGLAARHARGDFPFPVSGFRGSFLDLLFQLEPHGSGTDLQPLLVHLPGFNKESIRKTPLLELYKLGSSFEKSLHTLVREAATARIAPDEVERFLAGQPTLEAADAWLETTVTPFDPTLLADALGRTGGALALRVTTPAEAEILASYLYKLTGMDAAWVERSPVPIAECSIRCSARWRPGSCVSNTSTI